MFFTKWFPKPKKCEGLGLTYDDVLLVPRFSEQGSRQNLSVEHSDKTGRLRLRLPIISANMDMITGHAMADFMASKGGIGALHRLMPIEENVKIFSACKERCFVSIGCGEKGLIRARALYEAGARFINLDIAHGHSLEMGWTLKTLRREFSDIFIMAGNVATYDGARFLEDHGADLIKVGVGGGSVCTTRVKTGFGVANVSAISSCARISRSIVADGGIRGPADIVKALAFGADFVMIGGLLAGTRPTPGEVREDDGRKFKIYRGLDSFETQMNWFGEVPNWRTPEGISAKVIYRESENEILADLEGGIRSGLSYCGAHNIRELQKLFTYQIVGRSTVVEGLPHLAQFDHV